MTPTPKGRTKTVASEPPATPSKPSVPPSPSDTPPPFSLPHDADGLWEEASPIDEGNGVSPPKERSLPGTRAPFTPSFTPSFTLIGSGPEHGSRSWADMLSPGSTFGVYLVGDCIGQGGMARIYQAEHAGLRRQVALKVLIDGFARDLEGRERFLREARLAAAIKHPNVVNIFDVGVQDDIPYLVMELLEGQDLERLLESKGALDEGLLIDIMIPVIAGLTAVHDAGIVHRDLKPGNIFLAKGRYNDLEPKLLDFGISKAQGPEALKLTANRGIMGTPLYISPEGLHGGEMTPRSDQYSLGVVMYECATGCTPYEASAFADLSRLIVSGQYTRPMTRKPELSRRMARIIERAMSLHPQERFSDMREMGRELLNLAGQRTRITWGLSFGELRRDGTPVMAGGHDHHEGVAGLEEPHAGTPGGAAPPAEPPRRRRAAAVLVLAPLLLLIVVLYGWRLGMVSFHSSPGNRTAQGSPSIPPEAKDRTRGGLDESPADTSVRVALTVPAVPTPLVVAPEPPPSAPTTEAPTKAAPPARAPDTRPARTDTVQAPVRRSTRPASQPPRRPAGTAPGSDSDPEWALPAAGAPGQGTTQVGANESPILD
ncbi:MAG TPA: protein kinase [Polyangiaceae bacterium]|jgi:serine/threonine-protein kinase